MLNLLNCLNLKPLSEYLMEFIMDYMKINWLILQVYLINLHLGNSFDHDVKPGCGPEQEICSFELHVERRRTMALYGRPKASVLARDNAQYIVLKDGVPYKRPNDKCGYLEPITAKDLERAIIADGEYNFAYTINGQFPGPTIVVYYGQEVEVKVTNHLYQESLTIHWHGMRQVNTNWMDGVPSVTQCAIGPEETFTYRFVADPVGTHWYHSHQGAQRSDGMYGTFVVLPKPRPKPWTLTQNLHKENTETQVDEDFVLLLQDWYRGGSNKLFHTFYNGLAYYEETGPGNTSDCYRPSIQEDGSEIGPIPFHSALINGRGYRSGKMLPENLLEHFSVTSGKQYRFRVINTGLLYSFKVSFDNHTMTVVSSDGNDIEPVACDALFVTPGERFDVIVHANQTAGTYWIRVQTLHWDKNEGEESPHTVMSKLKYTSAYDVTESSAKKCVKSQPCTFVNCPFRFPKGRHIKCINFEDMRSTEISNLMVKPENLEQIFLTFQFTNSTDGGVRSSINGIQHLTATRSTKETRSSFTEDCSHKDCSSGACHCSHVLNIPLGRTVQIILTSQIFSTDIGPDKLIGSSHPVHLHGHHFYVLKVGYPVYNQHNMTYEAMNADIHCPDNRCVNASWTNPAYSKGDIPGMNLINPPKKDTVHVPAGGYVVIRFNTDNPGFWMLHCHIENHNLEGMALILQEGEVDEMNPPPAHFPKCGTFELSHQEFQNALQTPLKVDPLYATWIPVMVLINILTSTIVALVTWKCARKGIFRRRAQSTKEMTPMYGTYPLLESADETRPFLY